MSDQLDTAPKRMTPTLVVCGLYGVVSLIVVITWGIGATNDPEYGPLLVAFSLYAIFFISATVKLYENKHNLGTGLMIAGGIMSLPLGLPAIVFAVVTRRRLKKSMTSERTLPKVFECPNCKKELELEENERLERRFTCPECNIFTDMSSEQEVSPLNNKNAGSQVNSIFNLKGTH